MGIQILNKDVSVISSVMVTPKASIGSIFGTSGWAAAVPFVPGDFNFNNGEENPYTSNTVTFTKSGTLYIYGADDGNMEWSGDVYLNGSATALKAYSTAAEAITNKQTGGDGDQFIYFADYIVVDVNVGNTMYFTVGAGGFPAESTATITLSINNFSNNGGTVIDTFTDYNAGECYLTTATVQYKGLLDDGPELTAMRTLREHYRGDVYYDNLIVEYYQNAGLIIQGIDNSLDSSVDYEFIYQSVLKVKDYVDQSMWEEAKDEYVSTYFILKNKYI
jgi:hypothetical protein